MNDDTKEFTPGQVFRQSDETTKYWGQDGQVIYLARQPVSTLAARLKSSSRRESAHISLET